MSNNDLISALSSVISDYFISGIVAGADVIRYARCTLGIESPSEIRELLADNQLYGDGIIDLIFYPGDDLQLRVERVIPAKGAPVEVVETVIRNILQRVEYTDISFLSNSINFKLSPSVLRNFVLKLNLTKDIKYAEINDIERPESRERCFKARVKIRNCDFYSTPGRDMFLHGLIAALSVSGDIDDDTFTSCIELVLKLFGETKTGEDVYKMITEKKRLWQSRICSIKEFNDANRKYSMDYLMSCRISPPAIDIEKTRKNIALSDLICSVVFGMRAGDGMLSKEIVLDIDKIDGDAINSIFTFLS